MSGSRGYKGLQPSKPITPIKALIGTWRAPGPSAPRNPMRTMSGSRGCKGLQPSKPITAIKALIGTWRAPGPSAPRNPMGQCSALAAARDSALQVNNGHQSFDRALEGARFLGATDD